MRHTDSRDFKLAVTVACIIRPSVSLCVCYTEEWLMMYFGIDLMNVDQLQMVHIQYHHNYRVCCQLKLDTNYIYIIHSQNLVKVAMVIDKLYIILMLTSIYVGCCKPSWGVYPHTMNTKLNICNS